MKSQFEKHQAEMKSQFEKHQTEISNFQAEIDRLSAKVASLESEKAKVSSRPPQEAKLTIFEPKSVFSRHSFNINSIAKFIRNGLVCDIQSAGPKTHRFVLINGRREYFPDLVKQIIQDHIVPVLENETQEEKEKRFNDYMDQKGKRIDGLTIAELANLRRGLRDLEPTVIMDISKEIMKMI